MRTAGARSVVYRAEAVIRGDVTRVWAVLADLAAYAEWNPWLTRAEGELAPGGVVWAEVVLGAKTMRAKHRVLVVEPGARLVWRDAGWNAWFVHGQRARTLTALADGTVKLEQELLVDGWLRGVAEKKFGRALRDGLAAETAALKRRVEAAGQL